MQCKFTDPRLRTADILPTNWREWEFVCQAPVWCRHQATLWSDKRSSNLITGLNRPWGFQEVEAPKFQDNRHMKVVKLSALHTGRLYAPGNIPGTHFFLRLSQPHGHSAAGRIMSMKNFNDTTGNRTHDIPACSAVPQPTATPRALLTRDNTISAKEYQHEG